MKKQQFNEAVDIGPWETLNSSNMNTFFIDTSLKFQEFKEKDYKVKEQNSKLLAKQTEGSSNKRERVGSPPNFYYQNRNHSEPNIYKPLLLDMSIETSPTPTQINHQQIQKTINPKQSEQVALEEKREIIGLGKYDKYNENINYNLNKYKLLAQNIGGKQDKTLSSCQSHYKAYFSENKYFVKSPKLERINDAIKQDSENINKFLKQGLQMNPQTRQIDLPLSLQSTQERRQLTNCDENQFAKSTDPSHPNKRSVSLMQKQKQSQLLKCGQQSLMNSVSFAQIPHQVGIRNTSQMLNSSIKSYLNPSVRQENSEKVLNSLVQSNNSTSQINNKTTELHKINFDSQILEELRCKQSLASQSDYRNSQNNPNNNKYLQIKKNDLTNLIQPTEESSTSQIENNRYNILNLNSPSAIGSEDNNKQNEHQGLDILHPDIQYDKRNYKSNFVNHYSCDNRRNSLNSIQYKKRSFHHNNQQCREHKESSVSDSLCVNQIIGSQSEYLNNINDQNNFIYIQEKIIGKGIKGQKVKPNSLHQKHKLKDNLIDDLISKSASQNKNSVILVNDKQQKEHSKRQLKLPYLDSHMIQQIVEPVSPTQLVINTLKILNQNNKSFSQAIKKYEPTSIKHDQRLINQNVLEQEQFDSINKQLSEHTPNQSSISMSLLKYNLNQVGGKQFKFKDVYIQPS